jgi:hypothetical protein
VPSEQLVAGNDSEIPACECRQTVRSAASRFHRLAGFVECAETSADVKHDPISREIQHLRPHYAVYNVPSLQVFSRSQSGCRCTLVQ